MVDFSCLLASFFIFLGNLLLVIYYMIEKNREHWKPYLYSQFDADYLEEDWEWRQQNRKLEVAGKMITAVSWVILTAPVLQLSVVQSMGGERKLGLHTALVCFAIGGAITEVTAQLMHLGVFHAADWMHDGFELESWHTQGDMVGLKSLELSYRQTVGLTLWVDTIEYLCLSFMFLLILWSTCTLGNMPQSIGMPMAGLAFFIGTLSLADFVAMCVRFKFWKTSSLVGQIISVLNRVIFIPIFFLILAFLLPGATQTHQQVEASKQNGSAMPAEGNERHLD